MTSIKEPAIRGRFSFDDSPLAIHDSPGRLSKLRRAETV